MRFQAEANMFLRKWWARTFASINYRHCKANEYLATQRHDIIEAVWWARQANTWQNEWRKV